MKHPEGSLCAFGMFVYRSFQPPVVLGGSWASDFDLLVILESDLRRDKHQELISRALRPRAFPIDILAYTPAEVQACLKDRHSLSQPHFEDGQSPL